MEYRGRRNRHGRGHSRPNPSTPIHTATTPQTSKAGSVLSSLCSFFIMTSLIVIIYLMLEHQCSTCHKKCNMNNISSTIDDLSKNLSQIKDNYYDLEVKISKFSHDLPKMEGQIQILEGLANTIENCNFVRHYKTSKSLPKANKFHYETILLPSTESAKNISKIVERECNMTNREGCKD
ncbi:uncharacterized protein LOC131842582 [Achroia grisella]|uniref:uncharacterized protein LOC131842582 n=1 Tax=Achroia grisella TaxID=688607 RepID=UPI0027D2F55A|nr:uncharacterized protein LOC131842582 [Achroia grisella]